MASPSTSPSARYSGPTGSTSTDPMKSIPIRGIIPALVTPFHDDESLNLEQMKRQTVRAIDAGAHGVFSLGTN
ncbi:dihydrodipicolinate synthase family protein, partial [Streptomyces griseoincarnatus]